MNHVSGRNDVTVGYIVLTAETLRSSAERMQRKVIGQSSINKFAIYQTDEENAEIQVLFEEEIIWLT